MTSTIINGKRTAIVAGFVAAVAAACLMIPGTALANQTAPTGQVDAGSGATAAKVEVANAKAKTVTYAECESTAKKVTVPSTYKVNGVTYKVTAIAASAFKGNKTATTVTVGSNIKTIGKNAFASCKKLTKVTIKSTSLTTIGKNAFSGSKKLKTVTISSKKLKTIGASAFKGTKVKTITLKSTKLTKKSVKGCFKGSKVKTIKVPKKYVKKYKKIFTKKNCGAKVVVKKA